MARLEEQDAIRILIMVEVKRRDTFPMERIAAELAKSGEYLVQLCGTADFMYAVLAFQPQILVIGKPAYNMGDWLRCISGCTVVSLNPEQAGHDHKRVLNNFLHGLTSERGQAIELVDHHLIVDEQTKSFLTPYIDPTIMHVVGYPRLLRNTYAHQATPVKDSMVIGVLCGEGAIEKQVLHTTFENFHETGFEPYPSVDSLIANEVLEYLWINHIVSLLKKRYRVIVRYRSDKSSYLFEPSGVEFDGSDDLKYLFSEVDLVIAGTSGSAIEAVLVGIPTIIVASLFQLGDGTNGAWTLPIPRIPWQPESLSELLSMVDRRSQNDLELVPDMHSYETVVQKAYFRGTEVNNSIEQIATVIRHCSPGIGAEVDLAKYLELLKPSLLQRVLLFITAHISSTLAFRMAIGYIRVRRRLTPDSYLLHALFIPKRRHIP